MQIRLRFHADGSFRKGSFGHVDPAAPKGRASPGAGSGASNGGRLRAPRRCRGRSGTMVGGAPARTPACRSRFTRARLISPPTSPGARAATADLSPVARFGIFMLAARSSPTLLRCPSIARPRSGRLRAQGFTASARERHGSCHHHYVVVPPRRGHPGREVLAARPRRRAPLSRSGRCARRLRRSGVRRFRHGRRRRD